MSEFAWAGSGRAAQLLAWASAYGVAIYAYRSSTQFGVQRFILALWAGAAFSHLGWALLHLDPVIARPQLLFHPGAVSVLFLPLGVLLIAPWREALAALPLALAVSRLGCLPYNCCYAAPSDALVELAGLLLLHFGARRWPQQAPWIVLSGFGLVRLVSTPFRTKADASLLIDPVWIASLWVLVGIGLRGRFGSADRAADVVIERARPLLRSLLLVLVVWTLFALAAELPMDRTLQTFIACVMATAGALACRRWESPPRFSNVAVMVALGCAFGAAVAATIVGLESLVSTSSGVPWTPGIERVDWRIGVTQFASVALFAPVFQEILYRERILLQLRDLAGTVCAVVLSSALFAVSHLSLDTMVIAFLGGLAAGIVMLRSGSLPLVIGIHAGWNAAVLIRAGALGIVVAAVIGCASQGSERHPADESTRASADSDNYLRYVAFELPLGDAVLLRWSERQMPLRIFLPPPPRTLFSDPNVYLSAVRDGVLGWADVAAEGLPRFEFVDDIGNADIPIAWASEPQGDWYIAHTILNVVPSQRRFDVAQLLVTARWQDGHIAAPEDVRRVVLHEMGHALGFAGHSPDSSDIMYPTVSATDLSARDRTTLSALYSRPVGARVTGAKGARLR